VVAAITSLLVTALAGTGFGWTRALGTPTHARTWMSITTDLGWAVGTVLHHVSAVSVDATRHAFWLAGILVATGLSVVLWWRRERYGEVATLGLCLAVFVIAGPVVHPWYLLWAVVPLGAAAQSTAIRKAVVTISAALVMLVLPGGVQPGLAALIGAVLGTSAVLGVAMALTRRKNQRIWPAVWAGFTDHASITIAPRPAAHRPLDGSSALGVQTE
jgi:hypothetical protein